MWWPSLLAAWRGVSSTGRHRVWKGVGLTSAALSKERKKKMKRLLVSLLRLQTYQNGGSLILVKV